jgi:hypothetical protein
MADGKTSSNLGCVLALIAFPFVVLIGIVIGVLLRDDDDGPTEESVMLDRGEIDGVAWRVDAVRDVEGQTCVFLYEDDAADPLNGTCDTQPQDVTYGDQTVVFGRTDAGRTTASVRLDDDEVVEVETVTADGLDGRFYVGVVERDVDAVALE